MKVLKSVALALALVVFAGLPVAAKASAEIAGVKFEDRYVLSGQPLVLNGAGLRVKMIVKVYAVALYLPGKDRVAATALMQAGAKSVHIVMLRDVEGHELSNGLIKGMVKNLGPLEIAALQERIEELDKSLKSTGGVKKGDLVQLDFVPTTGTHVSLNGAALGKDITGDDFYRGLMKIWLGENPGDDRLKADLLGAASR